LEALTVGRGPGGRYPNSRSQGRGLFRDVSSTARALALAWDPSTRGTWPDLCRIVFVVVIVVGVGVGDVVILCRVRCYALQSVCRNWLVGLWDLKTGLCLS